MPVSAFVTTGHRTGTGRNVKVAAVRRKSFWSGVLQGLSGPGMMSAQPEVLNNLIEVHDNKIRLKIPGASRRYAFATHEEALTFARALTDAASNVASKNKLVISTETVRRLDQDGKLRQVRRPRVVRRAENGSE